MFNYVFRIDVDAVIPDHDPVPKYRDMIFKVRSDNMNNAQQKVLSQFTSSESVTFKKVLLVQEILENE